MDLLKIRKDPSFPIGHTEEVDGPSIDTYACRCVDGGVTVDQCDGVGEVDVQNSESSHADGILLEPRPLRGSGSSLE